MTLLGAGDLTAVWVIGGYLLLLLVGFSAVCNWLLKPGSGDYFVASRSIGPFLLLMSVFGTTMTAFSMVGSTAAAFERGVGVYGLMASTSGLVHSLVFFLVGVRLWAIGKRHDYFTQIQFFRDRFDSPALGYLLFPILVGLVIPYVLIGIIGSGTVIRGVTTGLFPEAFPPTGAVPPWLSGLIVCGVVLSYVLLGGMRAAALANTFQTIILMGVGILAFAMIAGSLGGLDAATQRVKERAPDLLTRARIGHLEFLTYAFVPLSIAMFPHIFQHWLTAKSARAFRATVIWHPIFMLLVWVPCILIGIWAAGTGLDTGGSPNSVLARMVAQQVREPLVSSLLAAGILSAIMGSLDSQFVALGTMFTHDVVLFAAGKDRFDERQQVRIGRGFIVLVVAVCYLLSLFPPPNVFDLGVWCFSGFAGLFPLVLGALYWRRVTKWGAFASILAAAVVWGVLFWDGMVAPMRRGERLHGEHLIAGMLPVTFVVAAAALALVAVSLVSEPPPRQRVERFFPPRRPAPGGSAG